MLDAALELPPARRDGAGGEVLDRALGADAHDDRRAAQPLVQPRAGRAPRPRARRWRCARSATTAARRTASRSRSTRPRRRRSASGRRRRCTRSCARRSKARSAAGRRRCSPCAFGAEDEGGLEIEISDDAPGERRRRSLEVLRGARADARRRHARRPRPTRARRCDSCCRRIRAASRIRAAMAEAHLLFVWKTSGYELREEHGDAPRSAPRSRRTAQLCA